MAAGALFDTDGMSESLTVRGAGNYDTKVAPNCTFASVYEVPHMIQTLQLLIALAFIYLKWSMHERDN